MSNFVISFGPVAKSFLGICWFSQDRFLVSSGLTQIFISISIKCIENRRSNQLLYPQPKIMVIFHRWYTYQQSIYSHYRSRNTGVVIPAHCVVKIVPCTLADRTNKLKNRQNITMTSCHSEPDGVSNRQHHGCLFTQRFIQAQMKVNIKAPCHWPLCEEFTGDRWSPRTNGQ